jgi:hypothetical protein
MKPMCVYALLILFGLPSLANESPQTALTKDQLEQLAPGKKVFVEKAEKDADVAMLGELKKWGRWPIVADESEADLIIRLRASGSGAWGVGHVQASILNAKTKVTLWTSKEQRGMRTIFSGYASPFKRAVSGIIKAMKKEFQ